MLDTIGNSHPVSHTALRAVALFEDFDRFELLELARIVSYATFKRRDVLVREGEDADCMFVILNGTVVVERAAPADGGPAAILALLSVGDFFGEMALLGNVQRAATVRAMSRTLDVGILDRSEFFAFLESRPRLCRNLAVGLSRRLSATYDAVVASTSLSIASRIAGVVLRLGRELGNEVESGIVIPVRLTNQEIASMVGTTRETVNRTLNRMWDLGVIEMKTALIVIIDSVALQRIADEENEALACAKC